MNVEILYFDGCPHWRDAGDRVRAAAESAGLSAVEIGYRRIATADEAESSPFAGSPTILIDGTDAFAGAVPANAFTCRLYPTESRLAGPPTVAQLAAVLRDRNARA